MEWLIGTLAGSLGTVGIVLLSNLVKAVLSVKQYRTAPKQFMLDQGFNQARLIRDLIKPVMDESSFNDVVNYAIDLPNYYDAAWDAALTGKEKPTIERIEQTLKQ